MNIKEVVPVIKMGNGCDYHRLYLPLHYAGRDFEEAKSIPITKHFETAKLFVFSREPMFQLDKILEAKKTYGFKMVMDIDDYWHLYPEHMIYRSWTTRGLPQKLEAMMKIVDAVTVTTERLAEKVRPFNKNVYVIPNAVPLDGQFARTTPICHEDKVNFGYVSGSSHLPDLQTIEYVFQHYQHLPFALCGYNNPNDDSMNVWTKMEKICSTSGKNPNYRRLNTRDLDNYMHHYDTLDVAIAPLKDNNFNHHKSSLKGYEAGAKKCAFICSNIPPYLDDLPQDIVFQPSSIREWKETIKLLKDNPSLVKERGEMLHEWVKENREINKINQLRMEVYEKIHRQ